MPTDKIAKMGLLISVGLILSYVESLVPIVPSVPGIKIGLANALVILILYAYGVPYCFIFQLVRVSLIFLLFGNLFSFFYSLAGAGCSLLIMILIKKINLLDVTGISMFGGITHNIAQIVIAYILVGNHSIFYYLPVLIISGAISGYLIGVLSEILMKGRLIW